MERRVAIARQIQQIKEKFPALGKKAQETFPENEVTSAPHLQTVRLKVTALEVAIGKVRPSATEQNVPGYTVFGVFYIVLPLAASFMRERQEGTFRRILAAAVVTL